MVRFPILALALAGSLLLDSGYFTNLLVVIGLHALPAIGLALLMGYTGQISLGHAAFYGLGAYGAALLGRHVGLDPWLGILLAAMIVAVIARWIGALVFRLKGHHLAMATLAFGIIVHIGIVELRQLTGGPNGLTGIAPLSLFGHRLSSDFAVFPVVWGACLAMMLLAQNLVNSPLGLSMRAIAENEHAAAAIGNDVGAIKCHIMMLSGFMAALGGGLYAHYIGYLSPGPFDVGFSIRLLLMVAVGGFANIWGVLFGVAFITLIGEVLKPLGSYDVIAYGVLLTTVIVFCPRGLLAGIGGLVANLRMTPMRSAG
ncbi:MAG: branched-chain amino acid ABC transporter permease [Xanthobacteraceae bacterium]